MSKKIFNFDGIGHTKQPGLLRYYRGDRGWGMGPKSGLLLGWSRRGCPKRNGRRCTTRDNGSMVVLAVDFVACSSW